MAILVQYRTTNRGVQHRFSPLWDIVQGFGMPELSITAVATDSTTVRVTFNREMPDNGALRCIDSYAVARTDNDAALAINSLAPEGAVAPNYVDVDVSEMQDGTEYLMSIAIIGESVPITALFTGIGVAPQVESASSETISRVRVEFSEPMRDNAALRDPGSYTITADVGSAARTVDAVTTEPTLHPSYVILTLDGALTVGSLNYNVEVADVEDVAGNTIDPAADDADFDGAHVALDIDHCELAIARLASQFRQPDIEALTCIYADRVQEVEQAAQDVMALRSLSTAYGAQLDGLGTLMGVQRLGMTDAEYIIRLRAQAQVISSSGRPDELIDILTTLDDGFTAAEGGDFALREDYPAGVVMGELLVAEDDYRRGEEFAKRFLQKAKPAGVKIILETAEAGVDYLLMREIGDPPVPLANAMSELPSTLGGHLKDAW